MTQEMETGNRAIISSKSEGIQWILTSIGVASFVGGYIIAVIAGIWWPENGLLVAILIVLGLLVSLLNITTREIQRFLVAAIALVIIGNLQVFIPLNLVLGGMGETVNNVVRMMAIITAPAAVIQALRLAIALERPG